MDKKGGFLKLYLTETGGYDGINAWEKTLKEKNEEMVRIYAEAANHGVDYTMIYDFVKDGDDYSNPEYNYGVITNPTAGFEPTETYYSVKNFLEIANNSVYIGRTDLSDHITGHVYLNKNEPILVIWSDVEYNSDMTYTYSFDSEVNVYDIFGKHIGESREVSVGSSPLYIHGIGNEIIYKAASGSAKVELEALADDLGNVEMFNAIIEAIDSAVSANDVYTIIENIYSSANNFDALNNNITEKSYMARLHTAAGYMVKSLAAFDEAEEMTYDELIKAYENYKTTLKTVEFTNSKGAQEIYDTGIEILDKISSFVNESACFKDTDNNLFVLNENGKLTINGSSYPGDMIPIKLIDPYGEIAYIGMVTTDFAGNYSVSTDINGVYGEYILSVKTGNMESPYSASINFEKNEDYQSSLLKINYGEIIQAEHLLNMSRDLLFKYVSADNNIIVDIAWEDVDDTSAGAICTVKNNTDKILGTVFLAAYKEGRLINLKSETVELGDGDKEEYSFELEYDEIPSNLKAFVWDGTSEIVPLSQIYEY